MSPPSPKDRMDSIVQRHQRGQFAEMYAEARSLAADYPINVFPHNTMGIAAKKLGRTDEAVRAYRRALIVDPGYGEVYNNLGIPPKDHGDAAAARALFERAAILRPRLAEAHWHLSQLKTYAASDPQVETMRRVAESPDLPDAKRVYLNFALAKAFSDLGDTASAYRHYTEANRLRKQELRYRLEDDLALLEDLTSAFEGPPPPLDPGDESAPIPIFIVGMPRSGTTLVEQILAAHSEVDGAGELNLLSQCVAAIPWREQGVSREMLQRVRGDYLRGIAGFSTGGKFVTDKMPLNFRWVGLILAALPEARIIHTVRDPRATCWSNFTTHFTSAGNGFANDIDDLIGFYERYRMFMSSGSWADNDAVLHFSYEDLTRSPEAQSERLLAHLGLELEPACLALEQSTRSITTASSVQVRQKIYTGSSDQWRRFADHIDRPFFR